MRILITVAPLMYREAIALAIHRDYADTEIMIASPEDLDGHPESFKPHMYVRNDTDGVDTDQFTGALCWIEILYSDGLDARVNIDGKTWNIKDISVEDLLALVKRTDSLISEGSTEPAI